MLRVPIRWNRRDRLIAPSRLYAGDLPVDAFHLLELLVDILHRGLLRECSLGLPMNRCASCVASPWGASAARRKVTGVLQSELVPGGSLGGGARCRRAVS